METLYPITNAGYIMNAGYIDCRQGVHPVPTVHQLSVLQIRTGHPSSSHCIVAFCRSCYYELASCPKNSPLVDDKQHSCPGRQNVVKSRGADKEGQDTPGKERLVLHRRIRRGLRWELAPNQDWKLGRKAE